MLCNTPAMMLQSAAGRISCMWHPVSSMWRASERVMSDDDVDTFNKAFTSDKKKLQSWFNFTDRYFEHLGKY